MKFVDLKKHLISQNYYCCYNIYGDDSFLVDSSKNMIINYATNKNEFDRIVASAENFNAESLLANLNSVSFFGGKKLVLIGGVESAKNKDVLNFVTSYLNSPNPNSVLVVISDVQLIDDKKLQEINAAGNIISAVDCSRLEKNVIVNWINNELKQKNVAMTDGAKDKLIDYTNGYLSRIAFELEKLVSYNQVEISEQDVELLVQKDLEYSIFELTENLGVGNAQKALAILSDMMADKKVAPSVLGLIQNYYRRLFFCSITSKTNAQLGQELGIKEFAVKKAKQTASLYSKITLKKILELCGDLDFKVKSGQMPYKSAVDYLAMYVLTNNKNTASD